jgi:hypothetical protein
MLKDCLQSLLRYTYGTDRDESNSNLVSSECGSTVEDIGLSIIAYDRIRWHSACIAFLTVSLLFLLFPSLNGLVFGMQMNITWINCFGVCLPDRDNKFTSPVLSQQRLAYNVLR